eukprot:5867416-Prymnesium_polylepis.1
MNVYQSRRKGVSHPLRSVEVPSPRKPHRSNAALHQRNVLTPSPSHILYRHAAASRLFTPP